MTYRTQYMQESHLCACRASWLSALSLSREYYYSAMQSITKFALAGDHAISMDRRTNNK